MPAYLVRMRANTDNPRELVGIFVAETMRDLFWIVDEAASPSECECFELGDGGVFWPEFHGQKAPRDVEPSFDELEDSWRAFPPDPSFTDAWTDALDADGLAAKALWHPIYWPEEDEEEVSNCLPSGDVNNDP